MGIFKKKHSNYSQKKRDGGLSGFRYWKLFSVTENCSDKSVHPFTSIGSLLLLLPGKLININRVVLIKLNKSSMQDLTWETKLLATNQRIIVLIAGSGRIIKQMWFVDLWAVHTIVIDNTVILWVKSLPETQYSTVYNYPKLLYLAN